MGDGREAAHFHDPIAQIIWNCKNEAEVAKRNRMVQNRQNFDSYHNRQDWSHKRKGQSMEFLPKMSMSVEQLTSFLQQGLMDFGEWFRIDPEPGRQRDAEENPGDPNLDYLIKPEEIQHLLARQLKKNQFANFLADDLKLGLLGALMIPKIGGRMVTKRSFMAADGNRFMGLLGKKKKTLKKLEKKVWELQLSLVRQEDYFPDPTGDKRYELERIELDWCELYDLAKAFPEEFDMDAVMRANNSTDDLQKARKAHETDQNITISNFRKRVTLYEFWGDLIDPSTGEVMHKNCVAAITTQGDVIRKPRSNPYWHEESPYVPSAIYRVPHSVWHKAWADAPVKLNIAQNELFNLLFDGGMMAVHGIKQMHEDWVKDPSQYSEGIPPGETIMVNSKAPPGVKVLERVDTGIMSQDGLMMYNLLDREGQQAQLTNDTRLGSLPQRQVKATEIVQSNQSITGILNGIVKVIEEEHVSEILRKSWLTMAQHMNDLDSDEVKALLGDQRAHLISTLQNEEIFAATAQGLGFKVFGLSQTLNKIQDFRKVTSLLQTIGTPILLPEFKKKYSMTRLMGIIVKSLDIDEEKIEMSKEEVGQYQQEQAMQQQMMMAAAQGGKKPDQAPNGMSQVPSMAATAPDNPIPRGALNQEMTNPG
jgi:hypothetical protein